MPANLLAVARIARTKLLGGFPGVEALKAACQEHANGDESIANDTYELFLGHVRAEIAIENGGGSDAS